MLQGFDTSKDPSIFDKVIEGLMIAVLAFMPFARGTAVPWGEQVVIVIAGAMVLCLVLKGILRPDNKLVWSWAYLPLGLFLLLAVVQLVPLPQWLLGIISPNTVAIKTDLLKGVGLETASQEWMTISFYGLATKSAIRLALAITAIFVVTINVYRTPKQITRLLIVIASIGAVVALVAVAQTITGTQKVYWSIPAKSFAGPYINRNNYCQFMNLSIGAGLAVLLIKLKEGFAGVSLTLSVVMERLGQRKIRICWCLGGMIVLGAASIFISLSRGGMISLLAAWGLVTIALVIKRRLSIGGWVMSVMALFAFICVLYLSFDAVYDRLATLSSTEAYQSRLQLTQDTARAWWRFPLTGSGLGTHEFVFPMFDSSSTAARAVHAENEYIQLAEETGVIGFLLVGLFGTIIWRSAARCLKTQQMSIKVAIAGLCYGLLAVLIHSFSDFALHLPSVAALAVIFCAIIVAMARTTPSRSATPTKSTVMKKVASAVTFMGIFIVWVWAIHGANMARAGEDYWRQAVATEKAISQANWMVSNADYAELIYLAEQAAQCEPQNARYRYWVNVYKWRSVSRVRDAESGRLVLSNSGLQAVRRIIKDLKATTKLCPTLGASYSLAGQIEYFVLGNPEGAKLIDEGVMLSPCDPTACFAKGTLAAYQNKAEESLKSFRRCLDLDSEWFASILDVYIRQIGRSDLALEIAKGNIKRLMKTHQVMREHGGSDQLVQKTRAELTKLLQDRCEDAGAPVEHFVRLGYIYLEDLQYEAAASCFRRAIDMDCSNVGWRFNLARALAGYGKISEAVEQAKICLKLDPSIDIARQLLEELSILPMSTLRDMD